MKKRGAFLIYMNVLAELSTSPRGPSRLAQACNINYGRLDSFVSPLLGRGLIVAREVDGEDVLAITEAGRDLYASWLDIWKKLSLD